MKRIVICRHGEFNDEGENKGHLSEAGTAQMIAVAIHITSIAKVNENALIISSPTTLMRESADALKKSLRPEIEITEDERFKGGMLEDDKDKKEAVTLLLDKAKNSDLVVVITNSRNIAALPQLFADHPAFKSYTPQFKSSEDGAFGINFIRNKFGFEI